MPRSCTPLKKNSTANSTNRPSPAHCAPNTRRSTSSSSPKPKPSSASPAPARLKRRSGAVVMQVTRSNIRLMRRKKSYLDVPCSRSAWPTSISVVWRAKLLARIGMKVLRSGQASMACTTLRR